MPVRGTWLQSDRGVPSAGFDVIELVDADRVKATLPFPSSLLKNRRSDGPGTHEHALVLAASGRELGHVPEVATGAAASGQDASIVTSSAGVARRKLSKRGFDAGGVLTRKPEQLKDLALHGWDGAVVEGLNDAR